MYLQNLLAAFLVGYNVDVRFFANADLVTNGVDIFSLAVGV